MSKRTIRVISAVLCLVFAAALCGCAKKPDKTNDSSTSKNENKGMVINVDVDKLAADGLSESVKTASTALKDQFTNAEVYPEIDPGSVEYGFASVDKALEFIGVDELTKFDLGLDERASKVRVSGEADGDITGIQLETQYWSTSMRAQLVSEVFTELYNGEYRINADPNGSDTVITTASGEELHVIKASNSAEGFSGMTGYIVKDSVLYSLYAAYSRGADDLAMKLFEKWAEQL